MKQIDTVNNQVSESGYFLCESEDGVLRCSCGNVLNKKDDNTYICGGGYPQYKFDLGEIILDKFGRIMAKPLPHDQQGNSKEVLQSMNEGKDYDTQSNMRIFGNRGGSSVEDKAIIKHYQEQFEYQKKRER